MTIPWAYLRSRDERGFPVTQVFPPRVEQGFVREAIEGALPDGWRLETFAYDSSVVPVRSVKLVLRNPQNAVVEHLVPVRRGRAWGPQVAITLRDFVAAEYA